MKKTGNREVKGIFLIIALIFLLFLVYPVIRLLVKSFWGADGATIDFYVSVLSGKGFLKALGNSFLVAGSSALITTMIAFLMAYTIHYTNVPKPVKILIRGVAVLPMLLPTLTYGFAIIYSFGKQPVNWQFVAAYRIGSFMIEPLRYLTECYKKAEKSLQNRDI